MLLNSKGTSLPSQCWTSPPCWNHRHLGFYTDTFLVSFCISTTPSFAAACCHLRCWSSSRLGLWPSSPTEHGFLWQLTQAHGTCYPRYLEMPLPTLSSRQLARILMHVFPHAQRWVKNLCFSNEPSSSEMYPSSPSCPSQKSENDPLLHLLFQPHFQTKTKSYRF